MVLQYLPTQEMAITTREWTSPEGQRALIESFPRLAPLLEDLDVAHEAVVVFQNAGKQEVPEVAELRTRTSQLDAEHDRYTRVIHHLLLGFAEMCDDEATSAIIETVRSELLPQGLGINQQSYMVQAGEAILREQRLSAASKRFLSETVVNIANHGPMTLAELVSRWHRTATELGEVETQKSRIKAMSAVESSRGPARRLWIANISHFIRTVALEKGMTEPQRTTLLQPVRDAEAKAAKRRALAKKKNIPFDPDAADNGETSPAPGPDGCSADS